MKIKCERGHINVHPKAHGKYTIRASYSSVQQNILEDDLEMYRVCAKFVPRILTEDKMENRKFFSFSNDQQMILLMIQRQNCSHQNGT